MKLLVAIVMLVVVPLVSDAQWQIMKEPQFWVLQKPTGANVANPQATTQDKQKNPDEISSLVKTEPQSPGSQGGSDQAGQDKDYQWWWNAIRKRVTEPNWWLVVLGFGQVVTILLQVFVGVRAANAAKKSANVADSALKLAHRAYVFVEEGRLEFGARASSVTFVCVLRNAGHTPATLLSYTLELHKGKGLPQPPPDFSQLPETPTERTTIRPQMNFIYPFRVDPEKWRAVNSTGETMDTFYLYGTIFYADSFEPRRQTRFAVRQDPFSMKMILMQTPGYTYNT